MKLTEKELEIIQEAVDATLDHFRFPRDVEKARIAIEKNHVAKLLLNALPEPDFTLTRINTFDPVFRNCIHRSRFN